MCRALLALLLATAPAAATPRGGPGWHDAKCTRYRQAWAAALAHQGAAGLSAAFLAAHQRFLDSNCTRRSDVCARSPEELKLADTMVVLSMNFGAASTFAPFYCRSSPRKGSPSGRTAKLQPGHALASHRGAA